MWANAFILVIYLELFILCNEIIWVITENFNLRTFLIFLCYFVFIHIYLHFFSYSGKKFFFLYKKSKENRKVRSVRLVVI